MENYVLAGLKNRIAEMTAAIFDLEESQKCSQQSPGNPALQEKTKRALYKFQKAEAGYLDYATANPLQVNESELSITYSEKPSQKEVPTTSLQRSPINFN